MIVGRQDDHSGSDLGHSGKHHARCADHDGERSLGFEVVERVVDRTELYVADEVFLCGTAAEISPITSVDAMYAVGTGAIGPVTHELERVFVKSPARSGRCVRPLAHAGAGCRHRPILA